MPGENNLKHFKLFLNKNFYMKQFISNYAYKLIIII